MSNVVNFLKHKPVTYNLRFVHDENGLSFNVYDIDDSEMAKLAVAIDLEAASKSLRQDVQCH